ncbi:hypothetical protein NPIL_240601 [Nephila pilipes]|uniref:Uncharacterized protein n=1 Tax=Nephila pilipes TaxID=299642 RepID=A0A8X6QIT6_NEPPI|nr:hypothetical protein NPIL_240601 [Nephila pilipes]
MILISQNSKNENISGTLRKKTGNPLPLLLNYEVSKTPITSIVDSDWITLKNIIIRNAKRTILRDAPIDNLTRTKLQKINPEIKLTYAETKRDKRNELCTTLDPIVPNTK